MLLLQKVICVKHQVGKVGVVGDHKMVQAVRDLNFPQDLSELCAFQGMVGYC